MEIKEAKHRIRDHMRVHGIGTPPHIYIGEALDLAITLLEKIESGDFTPVVHGEWLGERGDYVCSRCGSEGPEDGGYWASPYCPSCGAKMNTDGTDADIFWYPCRFENLRLLHEGTITDGCWYEWLDKHHNKEVARIKLDAEDHFFPNTSVIREEDVIAYREILEVK